MRGWACAGTSVRVGVDGVRRAVHLYRVVDDEDGTRSWGVHAVLWPTAVSPLVAREPRDCGVRWRVEVRTSW